MINWIHGFIVPTIELIFIGGIVGYILFIVGKAVHNFWIKQLKWWFKYKIRRKSYNEKMVKWCYDCIEKGIGWYDAKKLMLIKDTKEETINEILYIYDQIIIQLNKEGGKNGRQFERSNSKVESSEFPEINRN